MPRFFVCLLPVFVAFAGCDQIAVLDGSKAREADGVAIGSACRQAGRAIEDCFNMNLEAPKASVFAGWKEMNDYMVANKLEAVKPEVPRPDPKEAKGKEAKGKEESKKEESHAAVGEKAEGAAEIASTASSSAPGVPVVPASVEIPGLNTGTAVVPPAAIANAPLPKAAPAAVAPPAAPAPNSIALGGQNIPLAVPGTPPAAAPAAPPSAGAAPAHH